MNEVLQLLVVAVASFLASSGGFWVYLKTRVQERDKEDNATTKLLMGMARDRILSLGFMYLDRGWVTHDEYQNLKKYLVEPYCELGGNGTVGRLMTAVDLLPFRPGPSYDFSEDEKKEATAATIKVAEEVVKDAPTTKRGSDTK